MGKLARKLGKRLKKERGDMSQVQFARRIGVSKSSLNRMEIADQNVTLRTLEHLCKVLKCDIGELFEPE